MVRNIKLRIAHFAAVVYLRRETNLITTVPRRLVNRCAGPFDLVSVPPPVGLPAIPIDLFWSAPYRRDSANPWLRMLMAETFNSGEAARRGPCARDNRASSDAGMLHGSPEEEPPAKFAFPTQ